MKRKVFCTMLAAVLIICINELTYNSLNSTIKNNFIYKVRELENIFERTIVFVRGDYMNLEMLPQPALTTTKEFKESGTSLDNKIEKLEKHHIISTLRRVDSKRSQSERLPELSERKLKNKLKNIRNHKFDILVECYDNIVEI